MEELRIYITGSKKLLVLSLSWEVGGNRTVCIGWGGFVFFLWFVRYTEGIWKGWRNVRKFF